MDAAGAGAGGLLGVEPPQLEIPFELRKRVSSSVQLTNNSEHHVAFKVKTTHPKKYSVRPKYGIVPPRSLQTVTITMQAQREAPPDMQCTDRFLVQSIVMSSSASLRDIRSEMFNEDSGNSISKLKFGVLYVSPPETNEKPQLLEVNPLDIKIPFELGKEISCSIQLSNYSINYVAFKVKTTNAKKYYVRPNAGILTPCSLQTVTITMIEQQEVPAHMQCKDKFLVQSVVVGSPTQVITQEMFDKQHGKLISEVKLPVRYVSPHGIEAREERSLIGARGGRCPLYMPIFSNLFRRR